MSGLDAETGTQSRSRSVTQHGSFGAKCPLLTEIIKCDVDCKVSAWSNWSCNVPRGIASHKRRQLVFPKNNGTLCPVLSETEFCESNCDDGCEVA